MRGAAWRWGWLACMGLLALLLSGCLATTPPVRTAQDIEADRARFQQTDWGVLPQYVGQVYSDEQGQSLVLMADPDHGRMVVNYFYGATHIPVTYMTLEITPHAPGVFRIVVPGTGVLSPDYVIARLLPDGRFETIAGDLMLFTGKLDLAFTPERAHFRYRTTTGPHGPIGLIDASLPADVYTLPNGRRLPVNLRLDSAYRKYTANKPFGVWEDAVGKSYVSRNAMVRVSKSEAGNLVITKLDPYGHVQWSDEIAVNQQGQPSWPRFANFTPKTWSEYSWFTYFGVIMQRYAVQAGLIDVVYHQSYYKFNGHSLIERGMTHDWKHQWAGIYAPATDALLAQARRNHDEDQERARRRAEAAAEERAESARNNMAIMQGLQQGFAQAQASNQRLEQISRTNMAAIQANLQRTQQQQPQPQPQQRATANTPRPAPSQPSTQPTTQPSAQQLQQQRAEEARRKQAEQEQARAQAEANRQRELQAHLDAEKRSIQLRAEHCLGGGKTVSIVGSRPAVSVKKVANQICVRYEARCPGVPRGAGIQGRLYNYVGRGCSAGDNTLPGTLSCDPKAATVEVLDVSTC